ncbi:MAG: agmatinase [Desulfobulbaceae bacterium]|nr:agmatinase [Desulfobulbaceae bacterium]
MISLLGKDENFLGIDNEPGWPEGAGVVLVPVPFEQTSSYGTGSSAGPKAILEASQQVEFHDTRLGFVPIDALKGIVTLNYLEAENGDGRELADRLQKVVTSWLEQGKCVVTLGAEHTSVIGAIHAYAKCFDNLTVLQLDAHSDLRASYQDSRWNHACAMARVRDFNENIVQVGIRSECEEESDLVRKAGIPVFYAESIHERERKGEDWIGDVIAATSGQVYITFDCDALDPSIMPATGTPEPAGLDWTQVDRLLSRLSRERQVVGFDISELAPIEGLHHPQFTIAKLVYRLLGYISIHRTALL